jgi:nucleoside-diphosphate-sugar epimerase
MRVVVTGSDGYIGAVLCPRLMARGHSVLGIDAGYYRRGWLYDDGAPRAPTLSRDVRRIRPEDLEGADAVVHLAELSNDPLGENDPELTAAINHRGSVALARAAREAGVRRFVYASSCSIYGAGGDGAKTEASEFAPQTAYARCKVLVERDVGALRDERFEPVFLRNATAFGASPRQRFDLVLNDLAGRAWTSGRIVMTSDGSPWRPIAHVEDLCEAVACALEAPSDAVAGEAFNVGDDARNHRIREIAEIVARVFPGCALEVGPPNGDTRSYRVSFAKIRERMPGFRCAWDAESGARQLRAVFERIAMTPETFAAPPFTRLRELRWLRETGQLDRELFWTPFGGPRPLAEAAE